MKYIFESKFASNAGKDHYYTTGVDLELGMDIHLHCSTSFLIRQGPVFEKDQVNSSNTVTQKESNPY